MLDEATQKKCPICGQPNACAGSLACWCSAESFPKGLLELVPEPFRDKACICRACLVRYRQEAEQR